MRTVIFGQSRNLNLLQGLNKERRALVTEANRLLREQKLGKKMAKKRKRVVVD